MAGRVRFLNLDEKLSQTTSLGQKTVKPPCTTSLKTFRAVELARAWAKAVQPAVESKRVRLSWVGSWVVGVGAGAGGRIELVSWELKREGNKRRKIMKGYIFGCVRKLVGNLWVFFMGFEMSDRKLEAIIMK